MNAQDARQFATPQEAARKLGVHLNTVYHWIQAGKLPATQPGGPGGKRLIPIEALKGK